MESRHVGGAKVGRSLEVTGSFVAVHGVRGGGELVWKGQSPECGTTVHASFKLTHAPFIYKKKYGLYTL